LRHETFTSFTALNAAIRVQLERLNQRTMQEYGMSRRALFEQVDQPYLSALPSQPFVLGTWKQARVNLDYHIEVERHYYSVPCRFARQSVMVKITESLIEVFHDAHRIATHERSRVRHSFSTTAEHMPPAHWAYKTQSKEKFLTWAKQIGPYTTAQVQAIFDKREYEEQAFRSIRGIQYLNTTYGSDRLEAACRKANAFGIVGQRRVRSILKSNLESVQMPEETPHVIPIAHENVRGQVYYN
jgi:hypothetical protein